MRGNFSDFIGRNGVGVSLEANQISLPLVRLPAPQNERRDYAEETSDVKKVSSERNELRADQPNVTGASDKEIRPAANRERAPEVEKEKQGNKYPNIEQLIGPGARVQGLIGSVA